MGARHGRLSRTPVSPRDPALLTGPLSGESLAVFPAGREHVSRAELVCLAEGLLTEMTPRERWRRHEAMTAVLDWLEGFPGDTWQERWLLSGSDARGQGWGPPGLTPRWRNRITTGLGVLIVLRAVRPAYGWLSGSRLLGVYDLFRRHNQAAAFADLAARAGERGFAEHEAEALNALTRMVIVTGKNLTGLGLADVFGYVAARKQAGRTVAALPFAYELLRRIGGLQEAPPTLRQAQARGQLTAAELVDRYPLACPACPRCPGPLSRRALRCARLRIAGQPGPDTGQPVLGGPRTAPPRHQLPAPARRGGSGLEAADPHPARRAAPPHFPHGAVHRPLLLP